MTHLPTSFPAAFSSVAAHAEQKWANETRCPDSQSEDWVYTALQVYNLLISVLGILFNVFVLVVFWFHKKPCTVTEIYLGNLAVADLAVMSFLPFWAVTLPNNFNWPFGAAMCRMVNVSIVMNIYCSMYFLVLVSADRYLALVQPMSLKTWRTPRFAKLGCLLVWILGFILTVPTLVYRDAEYFPKFNLTLCYLKYTDELKMLLLETMLPVFAFTIPFSFISYCTWKIIQTLRTRLMAGIKSQKMEHRATTLMLAVLVAFLICWVPFHLVRIMELLYSVHVLRGCRLEAGIRISRQIFMCFAYFNSVLNPILYVIVGKKFRKKVQELLKQLIADRAETSSHRSALLYFWRSGKTEELY